MKKIIFFLTLTILLMLVMMIGAIFYIDFNGHKGFFYSIDDAGIKGRMHLEKYITENQIVYKSDLDDPNSLNYSKVSEKVYIDRVFRNIMRFDRESIGVYGSKKQISFMREDNNSDYVYLDHPFFINVSGGHINLAKTFMIPGDPVACLSVMEKYNFWRKGKQFFNTVIAPDGPVSPFVEVLEIEYLKDEYIQVMGRKIQAETYVIRSPVTYDIKVFLSKFHHYLLRMEYEGMDKRVDLLSIVESPIERIKNRILKFTGKLKAVKNFSGEKGEGISLRQRSVLELLEKNIFQDLEKQEIFINDGTKVVAGRIIREQKTEDNAPKIMIIGDDGPVSSGEFVFLSLLSQYLAGEGFIVMRVDSVTDGDIKDSFDVLSDKVKVEYVALFLRHVREMLVSYTGPVVFLGYKGGGYISLLEKTDETDIAGCIQVDLPGILQEEIRYDSIEEYVKKIFEDNAIKTKKNRHISFVADYTLKYIEDIVDSEQDILFFRRFNLPLRDYREYLNRDYLKVFKDFNSPLVYLYNREEKKYFGDIVSATKRSILDEKKFSKIVEVRSRSDYYLDSISSSNIRDYSLNEDFSSELNTWISYLLLLFEQKKMERQQLDAQT